MTLWSNRMSTGPAEAMMAFSASLEVDKRLGPDDIACSIAHVQGLGRSRILSDDEVARLVEALQVVGGELVDGSFHFVVSDEDIHTAIERRVTEICGPVGAKVHTGRSRNDQVAVALRHFLRREISVVGREVLSLASTLLARAHDAKGAYLPGYTHLQRAQPVLLAHQLLAHGWALLRDVDRLSDARRRLDVSPLGAGAVGGSTLALDPQSVASALGFSRVFENSIDAVSDRDFVAETLFDLTLIAIHLSRLGEEVVIYSSEEFGFYKLDDAWSTGSSMLPQKKNPDIGELARAKSGRLIGDLTGFLATLKGLPLSYNRDLQEDKEPLFDALDQVRLALDAMDGLVGTIRFDTEQMAAAADAPSLRAIDLAEWLVERGMPFRHAHGIVGELVRRSIAESKPLDQLVADHDDLGPGAAAILAPGAALDRRRSPGGGGRAAVATQVEQYEAALKRALVALSVD